MINLEIPKTENQIKPIARERTWTFKGLCLFEKVIFSIIDDDTDAHGYCCANNKYLAELCGCSERTVRRFISKLKKMKLITQIKFDGRYRYLKSNIKYGYKVKKFYLPLPDCPKSLKVSAQT